jgi:hypothetical protein
LPNDVRQHGGRDAHEFRRQVQLAQFEAVLAFRQVANRIGPQQIHECMAVVEEPGQRERRAARIGCAPVEQGGTPWSGTYRNLEAMLEIRRFAGPEKPPVGAQRIQQPGAELAGRHDAIEPRRACGECDHQPDRGVVPGL